MAAVMALSVSRVGRGRETLPGNEKALPAGLPEGLLGSVGLAASGYKMGSARIRTWSIPNAQPQPFALFALFGEAARAVRVAGIAVRRLDIGGIFSRASASVNRTWSPGRAARGMRPHS